MKFCIVGAGAIGGLIGVRLALAGEEVTLVARGANLAAIQANGMKLIGEDGTAHVARNLCATASVQDAGHQDYVIVSVKAHQFAALAPDIRHLLGAKTALVTMQNGIPWWYFFRHGGPLEGTRLTSVDPDGLLAGNVPIDRVIASVVYPAAELEAPGVVRLIEDGRFPLGELDGAATERLRVLRDAFIRAGFKAPLLKDCRKEIWIKLWGNVTFNPVSALTRATLAEICAFPETRALAAAMMAEAQAVANKLGIEFPISIDKRIAGAQAVGAHKTSMLQDIEAGRPIELEALVGSVVELARLTATPTPHIDAVYACAKLLAETIQRQAS